MHIEEQFLIERCHQDHVGLRPALKTFQSGQGGCPILVCVGEGLLKGVIAREDRRRAGDVLIPLLDQLLRNPRTVPQARVDLRERVLSVGVPDQKVGRGLQERQQRDKEKKQPAAETAESKVQR